MKVCYVFSASGDDHVAMMKLSEGMLKRHIPDADVLEIGEDVLDGIYDGPNRIFYTHLAIPLLPQFSGYDVAVFLDADCEVVSPDFAKFAELGEGVEVFGVECHRFMRPEFDLWPVNKDRKQINGGVVGYNLREIDKDSWRSRLIAVATHPNRRRFNSKDEGFLFLMTDARCVDDCYNNTWKLVRSDTMLVHHRAIRRRAYLARAKEFK